jgi:TonB-dependent SusC/RagA subfamily outer membrane receptor
LQPDFITKTKPIYMVNPCFSRRYLRPALAALISSGFLLNPVNLLALPGAGKEILTNPRQVITGTITDAVSGTALAGASIGVKGSRLRTLSDASGKFSLTVPNNNSVLEVSYVGYASREVTVGNNEVLVIALQPNSADLAQVVVVGYGTQNKKDVTGAVKSLKSDAFNKGIVNTPQELLQGKVAGVNVTSASGEPGGILGITVRGPGGVRTGSTPLFVVDGLPLDNSSTGGGDPLNFINPQDIESIDVLKDASATAIYGSRGANGVILITTKKEKQAFLP